jgi:hypothetical protein
MLPVVEVFEIHDTGVVVILTRKHNVVQITRMSIRYRVLNCVPSAIGEVDATQENDFSVANNKLLVVSP